jgi:hypothetical protein
MPPAAAIAGGAQAVGSFLQSNEQKNAQRANLSQETSLDNQMLGIYQNLQSKFNSLWGSVDPAQALGQAKTFYGSEVQGGLSPAVIGSAESEYAQQNASNLATMKNQLGPYTPNVAGQVAQFNNNAITGNVSLQQQLAALNQQTRQQGAAGLAGIGEGVAGLTAGVGESVASGIGGLASQFGQASEFNAANAGPNPFSSIGAFLAANPNILGGGPQANPSGANGIWDPYGGPVQPGQGGLGAVGGVGQPSGNQNPAA